MLHICNFVVNYFALYIMIIHVLFVSLYICTSLYVVEKEIISNIPQLFFFFRK